MNNVNIVTSVHKPLRIAVLVSGGGTNLQAIIDEEKTQNLYKTALVVSSTKDAYALQRAKKVNIPCVIASPHAVLGAEKAKISTRDQKRLAVSDKVLDICLQYDIDAIVLAGFLTVLSGNILKAYERRIINLHPALLPKFGGVGMWGHHVHEAVLQSGEKESGCTIHLVDSGCDTGDILLQRKVNILPNDTPESLYARIAPLEHEALVSGIKLLAERLGNSNV